MNKDSKIYVAGHTGLVGSAIMKRLIEDGFNNILTRDLSELDLRVQPDVQAFFQKNKPEFVILAAAKVGGIYSNNKYRADFISDNLLIELNVINESFHNKVNKLLFLGSTCIYPRNANQPITEDELLTSPLEYTNEPYAIAKIAGIKLCESFNLQYGTDYISVMPTNIYGPNDNFNLETAHVLPALLRKMHIGKCLENNDIDAIKKDLNIRPIGSISGTAEINRIIEILPKFGIAYTDIDRSSPISPDIKGVSIEIWGTGTPRREFLWSEDLADACIFLMNNISFKDLSYNSKEIRNTHINIGTGIDITINELAELIKKIVGFKGKLVFNSEKPDGTMRKLISVDKIQKLGWKHNVELTSGIKRLYDWYLSDQDKK